MIFSPYSDMLQNYYMAQYDKLRDERKKRFAAIQTKEDAEKYAEWAKTTIRNAFGPLPEKTPLNPKITSSYTENGIITETVLYESRPGFFVSGILCRPENATGKLPAVLELCGHNQEGKSAANSMMACFNLARCGYVSFLIDPAGQGERPQFTKVPDSGAISGACCIEHNQLGKMLELFDEHFGTWRLWDAIRAIDYLISRDDVDSAHIGVTGCSGGGTLTSYLWAVDDRLTMAAPSCFLTTFYRNFDNELPSDSEQALPGLSAAGFEMADFLIARAPLPAIVLSKDTDFFDPRGTDECVADAKKIYDLLGKPENIVRNIAPGVHGFDPESRMAMYRFFSAQTGCSVTPEEKYSIIPSATESQDVSDLPGAKTIPDFLKEMADVKYPAPTLETWQKFLRENHNIIPPEDIPDYKQPRPTEYFDGDCARRRCAAEIAIKTDRGILATMFTLVPDGFHYRLQTTKSATLYVADFDAENELFAKYTGYEKETVFALDVRGCGKSTPYTSYRKRNRYAPYGTAEYLYDEMGLLLNDSLYGGRCRDILAALKLLRSVGAEKIHVIGVGQSAPLVLGASLAAPELCDSLELHHLPRSMREMVKRGIYRQPQSYAPRAMLKVGDFADMTAVLPMPVTIKEYGTDFATPCWNKLL